MARRNRSSVNRPQRSKRIIPTRVERILSQLADDAAAAILYMGQDR